VPEWRIVERSALIPVVAGWSVANAVILLLVMVMAIPRPSGRLEERFEMGGEPATLTVGGVALPVALVDLSLTGALLEPQAAAPIRRGERVVVAIAEVPPLEATVAGLRAGRIGLRFDAVQGPARAALIRRLFSEAHAPVTAQAPREGALLVLLSRLLLGTPPKPA
jgi:cellulose synthase (UDP-forming)